MTMEDIVNKFNTVFINYERKINSIFSYQVIKVNIAKPLFQWTYED
jgi:hypothetical protein